MSYRVLHSSLSEIGMSGEGLNLYGGGGAPRVRAAVHESGHALVVAALGASPSRVWIDVGGGRVDASGAVTRGQCTYGGGLPPLGMLMVSLAGPLAEELLSAQIRDYAGRPGHDEDHSNQRRYLVALGGDAATITATAEPIVRGLLKTFADDLDQLALKLLQRNEITSDLMWFLPNARAYGQDRGRALLVEMGRRLTEGSRDALAARSSSGRWAEPSPAFRRLYGLG